MSLEKSMKIESNTALKIQMTSPHQDYLWNLLLTTVTLVVLQQSNSPMERESSLEFAQMVTAHSTEMRMTPTTSTSILLSVAGNAAGSLIT